MHKHFNPTGMEQRKKPGARGQPRVQKVADELPVSDAIIGRPKESTKAKKDLRQEAHRRGEAVLTQHDGDPTQVLEEALSGVEGHAGVKKKKRKKGGHACVLHVVCVRVVATNVHIVAASNNQRLQLNQGPPSQSGHDFQSC